jgi:hypothetical protein
MVKIALADGDYVIETISGGKKETFHFSKGIYDGKLYLTAVMTDNSIILEGEENLCLKDKATAVYIRHRTVVEQAADFLKDDSIYMGKSDAVPEGKEKELLHFLMS